MPKLIANIAKNSASHRVLAFSLLAMGLSAAGEAQAACSPTAAVSNATITCTGDTTNQNGFVGYGTNTSNNNTLTVQSGASVTGTNLGILQGTGFTLNNSGTITGVSNDAVRATSLTFTNSGTINGGNVGVNADGGTLAGSNSGTIFGPGYGVYAVGALSLTNSGMIEGRNIGGIRSQTSVDLTNSGTVKSNNAGVTSDGAMTVRNSGTISANGYALNTPRLATVENSGSITSGNDAIHAGILRLTNSGQISSTGGSGVNAYDGAGEITNSGTIAGYNFGVYALGAANVNNSGTINGQQLAGVGSAAMVDLTNSGTVTSAADGVYSGNSATVRNSGTIFGNLNGLRASGAVNLTNSGTVEGRDVSALYTAGALTLDNSGVLKSTNGEGVVADGAINATNSGTITAYNNAIFAGNSLTLTNSGTIVSTNPTANAAVYSVSPAIISNSGTIQGFHGISSLTNVALTNSGKITSVQYGVYADGTLNLTNSGTMIGTDPNNGTVVRANGAATVNNSGTIQGFNGVVSVGALTLVNSGKIVAVDTIVNANMGGTITNSGTMTTNGTAHGIFTGGALTLNNSGTISTGGNSVDAQGAGGRLTVINSGTISDTTNAIVGTNAQNHTITNTGLISGGTRAIWLGAGNDTLTLGRTSRTSGRMDLGAGTNTVNIETGGRSAIYTFEGTGITYNNTGTGKLIQLSPNQVASIGNDGGGDNQSSRLASETAGMVSGVIQGRLSGNAPGVVIQTQGGSPVLGFAEQAPQRDFGPFSWDGQAVAKTPAAVRGPVDPMSIWASAFGGIRSQSGSGTTVGSDLSTFGGVVGVDRRFSNVVLGAFIGGGSSQFKDRNNQTVNTGLVVGGIYGRYEQGRYFVDATLQGGHMSNRSKRETVNNLVPGGLEAARATYSGYYISPELVVGQKIQFANGINVTPIARIRYTGGSLAGYTETGSILAATVGRRAFHSLEERGEVEVTKTMPFSTSATVNLTGRLGLIAQHRLGGQSVNATVLGTGVSFTASGRATTIGALAGFGVDLRYGRGVNIFGTLEGTAMNDKSVTGVARGGVRVAF